MSIPNDIAQRVWSAARSRCGYCLSPQHMVYGKLEIEHTIPKARGGTDEEANLWISCGMCNTYKGVKVKEQDPITGRAVALFNPRRQRWKSHFAWSPDGTLILGKTACGRATVVALRMNNSLAATVRRGWVQAGWHPPTL